MCSLGMRHFLVGNNETGLEGLPCKHGNQPLAGLLQCLPIPIHAWSHTSWSKRVANRQHSAAPTYTLGLKVWLSTHDSALKDTSRKLAPCFIGPFPVICIVNLSSVRLCLPASMWIHPTFPMSQVKPVSESPLNPPADLPPLPHLIDNYITLTFRHILDVKHHGRGFQYLINWEGYRPKERS